MECFQILDRARATEVEGVLTDADVARVVALPLGDVREFVFDHGALAQRAASGGRLESVCGAAAGAVHSPRWRPSARCRTRRWCIARAGDSDRRRRDRTRPRCRTRSRCTCPFGHSIVRLRILSVKADLGNRLPLRDFHGLQTILPRLASTVIDERAVDVPAVNQQVVDVESLVCHIDRQGRHRFVLGTIRRRDGAGEDQTAIDVRRNVTLESVEPLTLALASVTHLRGPRSRRVDPPPRPRECATHRPGDRAPDPASGSARGPRPAP